jgi:hypothetical protein
MLDGLCKQLNTTKPAMIAQSEPMMEVTPEPSNARSEIAVKESGRVRVFRRLQPLNSELGIFANSDGVSNVTNDNLEHPSKTELPSVETEEGTVKVAKLVQPRNASDSILSTVAGDSKTTSVK